MHFIVAADVIRNLRDGSILYLLGRVLAKHDEVINSLEFYSTQACHLFMSPVLRSIYLKSQIDEAQNRFMRIILPMN
jgi:hypothetical protein